jgi:hypothetical protein
MVHDMRAMVHVLGLGIQRWLNVSYKLRHVGN